MKTYSSILETKDVHVVIIFPDRGERYLSTGVFDE